MNRPIHPHSWRQSYVLLFLGVMLVAWFALPQTAAARTMDPGHLETRRRQHLIPTIPRRTSGSGVSRMIATTQNRRRRLPSP